MSLEPLAVQLKYTHYVLMKNLEGITEEEALITPESGGNCANWVVGHILEGRNGLLKMLGEAPLWDDAKAAPYKRGATGAMDPATTVPVAALLAAFSGCQDTLVAGLKRFDPERLDEKAPWSPTNNPDETFGSLMAGVVFHEAYHVGQTGVLRRVMGKAGAVA